MVTRRTGIDPLAYLGVEPSTPAQYVTGLNRNPTTTDYDNFNIGTTWITQGTNEIWVLVSKANFIATWVLIGTGSLATTFDTDSGIATPSGDVLNIVGGDNITTSGAGNTVTINVDGTTDHAVQIGNAGGNLTSIAVGTDGQVIIGATGADPEFATLTSSGGSIVFTPGPNSLNLEAMAFGPLTIDADSGSASPAGGVLEVFGGDNITTSGTGNTLTAAVSGTTDHAVQIGNASGSLTSIGVGDDGYVLLGATGADPAFATLTSGGGTIVFTPGPNSLNLEAVLSPSSLVIDTDSGSASPAGGILNINGINSITVSGSGNTIEASVTGTTQYAPQMGTAAGALADVGVMTTGQLMIGVTGSAPNLATLTAGSGITIDDTGSPGNITISASGSGSGAVKITTFNSSGTFTKDAGAKMITYYIYSAGGGGGSGGRGASASSGGGGGGCIGYTTYSIPAAFVGATESVVIGAGGLGGLPQTLDNSAGNVGGEPTVSTFGTTSVVVGGSDVVALPPVWGGNGGTNGTSSALGGQAGKVLNNFSGVTTSVIPPGTPNSITGGGAGNATSTGGSAGLARIIGSPTCAGGGGGISGGTPRAGGNGGILASIYNSTYLYGTAAAGGAAGVAGTAGSNSTTVTGPFLMGGYGGGGGGGHATTPGAGGNGGFPGGAGGGGGGTLNGNNSGAGGNGADGQIIVIEYLG